MLEWTFLGLCPRIQQNHRTEGIHRENSREEIWDFAQYTPEHQAQHTQRVVLRFTHQSPWSLILQDVQVQGYGVPKEKHCVSWSTIRLLRYTPFTVTPEDLWSGFASCIGAIRNYGGLTWRLPVWELAVSWVPTIASGCNVQRPELSTQFGSRCISLLLSPAGLCMPF